MQHAILCEIKPGSLAALKAHRLQHLEYIQTHKQLIAFGGPTHGADGLPQTMIIIVRTESQEEAEAFIHAEPHTASGEVFASVQVFPWSQVIPERESGDLERDIMHEKDSKNIHARPM